MISSKVILKILMVAPIFFCAANTHAANFIEVFNELSKQANIATKIASCKQNQETLLCETSGTRAGGMILATNEGGIRKLALFAASKPAPDASSLFAWASAYSILILITDLSLGAKKISSMVAEMVNEAVRMRKEVSRDVNGHIYSFNLSNLTALGVGEGYMITYTAR